MREEIITILAGTGPGHTPGEVFRDLGVGRTVEEIARTRGATVGAVKQVVASLTNLFDGVSMPTTKSAVRINARLYRDILAEPLSDELRDHLTSRLLELKEIDPSISVEPTRVARAAAPAAPRVEASIEARGAVSVEAHGAVSIEAHGAVGVIEAERPAAVAPAEPIRAKVMHSDTERLWKSESSCADCGLTHAGSCY